MTTPIRLVRSGLPFADEFWNVERSVHVDEFRRLTNGWAVCRRVRARHERYRLYIPKAHAPANTFEVWTAKYLAEIVWRATRLFLLNEMEGAPYVHDFMGPTKVLEPDWSNLPIWADKLDDEDHPLARKLRLMLPLTVAGSLRA